MTTINIYFPLITADELKTLISEVNNNISNEYIKTTIEIEQKKSIRPLLGYSLYNQIQLELSGNTLTPENELIYDDYIKLILAYSVYKKLVITISYQLENSGLRKKYSDVSELAEQNELSYVRKTIQEDLDFYKNELIKYINENRILYPLYFNETDKRKTSLSEKQTGYQWTISKI